jgi:hypothetical protein
VELGKKDAQMTGGVDNFLDRSSLLIEVGLVMVVENVATRWPERYT